MNYSKKNTIYQKLEEHKRLLESTNLRELFENDTLRFEKYSLKFNDILLDYSKNFINDETLELLIQLADESYLTKKIDAMFTGKKINFTEHRAVLHTALRDLSDEPVYVDGINVKPEIKNNLNKVLDFAESIRNGIYLGYADKIITDVVNIGIGGSHLGPEMVCTALSQYSGSVKVHFVSNVDPSDISEKLKHLNAETTLFLIASKTFTTQETMANAAKAKKWFLKSCSNNTDAVSKHFIALSTNINACLEFGISKNNIFGFWDWVGGRYSLWSAIGLCIAIYIGADNFIKLLNGANQMDKHFRNTPLNKNIPVIMALLGVWYINFWNATTQAIIPYNQYLLKFSEFLQQLDMESNGKRVNSAGKELNYATGGVVWGTIGTNSQHSFFQLLHQGTHFIPIDFIAGIHPESGDIEQHEILLSNFFAQTEALMKGKNDEEVREELNNTGLNHEEIDFLIPHKVFPGNKPTNSIVFSSLTPENLGSLIVMYEHKVFVQGIIWEINSFDQWGVELGKQLAKGILNEIKLNKETTSHDSSTNGLINYYLDNK